MHLIRLRAAAAHTSRRLPRSQRSPARLTGSFSGFGTSSGSVRPELPPIRPASSSPPKPVNARSKPNASRSPNSSASASRSQPAFKASFVVGDHISAFLSLIHSGQLDSRYTCHLELPRRQQSTVPGDDPVLAVDQDRIGEPELANGSRDLSDLLLAVSPCVPRICERTLPAADGFTRRPARIRTQPLGRRGGFPRLQRNRHHQAAK